MTQARTLNNRYELQAKIGDGGMAAVYRALDLRLNRTVAIKILRDSYAADQQFLARFKREAQQAASLNHPNIVRVFDVGDDGGLHYFVMELVEGTSLKELIVKQGKLPVTQATQIAAEICDAIAYSHSQGIIHRDVKPQNILIDRNGRVKVTDFGIAKSSNAATLTETGITMGTVHYFSPEQAKGLPVQPQSDIYSIGVVLYEMLTGSIPFDSDNAVALALKHIEEPPPPPRSLNPSIPPAVEALVLRALAKDPARRFGSADEMAEALRNVFKPGAQQATTAVRPEDVAGGATMVNPIVPQNFRQPQTPVIPPSQPVYQQPVQTYTNAQPVYQQPAQPLYRQATNATNASQYNTRTPVRSQVYEDEEVAPARRQAQKSGGGCLPWFIAGMSLVMIAVLVVAGYVLLNQANTGPATRPASPTSQPAVQPTTVSAAKVRVPNVVNRSQTEAEKLIKDANLEVGEVVQEFNQGFPANAVIKTDPAVNAEVNPKTKIKLTVSKGTELVRLLDYANTNGDAAEKALKDLGFKVERTDEFSTVQDKAVIRTEPKGGADVQIGKGSLVKLFVSKGPAPAPTATTAPTTAAAPTAAPTNTPQPRLVAVPGDLIGKPRATAENAVRNAGLTFRVEEWDENDIRRIFGGSSQQALNDALRTFGQLDKGQVLGTDPPAGTQLPQGREILIAVKK